MRYVIVATSPDEGGALLYFCGDCFKTNRCEKSVHCRRMIESGARVEVRRVASAE